MKKVIYTAVLFLLIGMAAISCSKDKTVTKTETPAKATIAAKLVVDTSVAQSNGPFEFGNKFFSSKNGKITKLGCRMPEIGSYRVSLWNFSTTDIITATTITVTDTAQFKYNDISAVDITANTRYVISINNTIAGVAKKYFVFFKMPALVSIYPFSTGSITYETFQEKGSLISIFPSGVIAGDQVIFAGVPDFQFEYTE